MPPFQLCANCRHKTSNWCSQCDRSFGLSVTPLDFSPGALPQEYVMSVQGMRDIAGLGYSNDSFATPLNLTVPQRPQYVQAARPQHQPAYVAAPAPAATASYGHPSSQSRPPQNAPPRVGHVPQVQTPSHFLVFHAIFFPKDEDCPRVVQVPCIPPADPNISMCPVPIVSPYIPTVGGYPPVDLTLTEGSRGQPRASPLQIWFSSSGSGTLNRAIWRATSGQAAWAGDVLVMRFIGSRMEGYTNVTMNELPDLAQFFKRGRK